MHQVNLLPSPSVRKSHESLTMSKTLMRRAPLTQRRSLRSAALAITLGLCLATLSTGVLAQSPTAADGPWTEFRGPTGQGLSQFQRVPTTWSDDSPSIRWRTPIAGEGWSSPVFAGDQIWLTTAIVPDGSLRAVCLDFDTGKIVHDVEVFQQDELGPIHQKNSHASPTPLFDGEHIYVHFGEHGTACLDLNGKVLWERQWSYGHLHGPGGSPVLSGNRLIFSCDGTEQQFVIALDKTTGETLWQTPRTHFSPDRLSGGKMKPIAFATPLLVDSPQGQLVLSPGADSIVAYEVATGKEVWWSLYDGYSNVPRPVVAWDKVFVSSGYMSPKLYAISLNGRGDVTESHVDWVLERGAPNTPSPIAVGDQLYVISDRGILTCLSGADGQTLWKERLDGEYSASPILAGGLLYFTNETGMTTVLRPGTEFELVARNEVAGRTLASPVPFEGGLLLRTDSALLRIEAE